MGKVFDERWEIVKSIGEGGQAQIFLVKSYQNLVVSIDEETGFNTGPCALKRLKNVKRLDRFRQEIEAIKRLDHPNVIKVIDYNLEGDKPYLVTEYCEGGSLEMRASDLGKDRGQALRFFLQICEGVAAA